MHCFGLVIGPSSLGLAVGDFAANTGRVGQGVLDLFTHEGLALQPIVLTTCS